MHLADHSLPTRAARNRPTRPGPAASSAHTKAMAGISAAISGPARRHVRIQAALAWWYCAGARAAQALVLALVAVALAVRLASGALVPHGPGISGAVGPASVTVSPGDTWWSVAIELFPEQDPRQAVDQLRSDSSGRALRPGETIQRTPASQSGAPQVASGLRDSVHSPASGLAGTAGVDGANR